MKLMYMEKTPHLKGKARKFGRNYRKIAVVEIEEGFEGTPKMISERAIGVKKVIECHVMYVGTTERSVGFQMMKRLQSLTTV